MKKFKITGAIAGLLLTIGGLSQGAQACGMPSDVMLAQVYLNTTHPEALHVTGATWALQQAGTIDMPDRERITATGDHLDALIFEAHLADLDSLELLGAALHENSLHAHAISLVLIDGMHWARFLPDPRLPYAASNFNCLAENRTLGDLVVVTTKPVLHGVRNGQISIAQAVEYGAIRLYGDDQQTAAFMSDFGAIGAADILEMSSKDSIIQRLAKAAAIEELLSSDLFSETQ